MSDKKPDQRFAMVALELGFEGGPDPLAGVVLTEAAPTPRQLDVLRVNVDGTVACPRCGNSAFEPASSFTLNSSVACRGCPPPAPTYELPNGFSLKFDRYRCAACGKQTPVTMTLSEVNLYCGGCSRLAIHTRQEVPKPKEGRKRISPEDRASRRKLMEALTLAATPPSLLRGPSVFVDEANDIFFPDDHPALVELTRTMMSILELEDFDAYAARRRAENRSSDDPRISRDVERGTGRTWRGIVELLARHYLAATRPTVWVLGGSGREDSWLRNEVMSIRNELGNDHPAKVEVVPPSSPIRDRGAVARLAARNLRLPSGVMLLVDHTYYDETGRRGGFAGATYKPDF